AYTFSVVATNAVGPSQPSARSSAVTPGTLPSAPTNVVATGGVASATISWTAAANGGSPITSYTITPYVGAAAQVPTTITGSPPATLLTLTGLTNGTTYTFTVSASNASGTGAPSPASGPVTPAGPPAAPAGVSAVPGNASASISWTAPANGGSAINGYTVTPFIGANPQTGTTVGAAAVSATVGGLTN